jgi:hypothetical protein
LQHQKFRAIRLRKGLANIGALQQRRVNHALPFK